MESKSVLSCINGFRPSEAVIDYGSWLARSANVTLKLFHVIDTLYHESEADLSGSIGLGAREDLLEEFVKTEHEQNKLLQKRGKLILEAAEERARKSGAQLTDQCLRRGKLLENVLDLKDKVSIAVMGRSGEKVGHKVEFLVRAFEKPILIVGQDFQEPKSICLAFDGSEGAKKALNFVVSNPGLHSLQVHLVHVGPETDSIRTEISGALHALEKVSAAPRLSYLQGDVGETLNDYVLKNEIDLLCTGAFGHHWLRDLVMGSLTSKLISIARVPILLVR